MGRTRQIDVDQEDLFPDLQPDVVKRVRPWIKKYQQFAAAISEDRRELGNSKEKIIAIVEGAGVEADSSGVTRFSFNGLDIEIAPTKKKIKIRTRHGEDDEDDDADEEPSDD